jgi:hypothetical protein
LILYALLAVAFFTMAAIVLDLAALRTGRNADRAAADLAVTAGVTVLDATDATSVAGACNAAWGYVLANRSETQGAITAPDCAGAFLPTDTCSSALTGARTASGSIGDLTVEITNPVPDSSALMQAETQGGDSPQSIVAATDGLPCERLAVRIVRPRRFLLSGVVGIFSGSTDVHSVARPLTATSTTEVPAVVALERTACDALRTDPGGSVLELGSAAQAGVAIVDSDGSGAGCGFTIAAGDAGDPAGRLVAKAAGPTAGQIRSFALSGSTFAAAYDPAAVGTGRLAPQPTPALARTGRALVDSRYHCPACGPGGDPIGALETARSGPAAPATTTLVYPGPCTISGGPGAVLAAVHLYVDCDDLVIDGPVTFLGQSLTVKGNVTITDQGCLAVNDTACGGAGITVQDADVFVRGSFAKAAKGEAVLPRTFVYAVGSFASGVDPDTAVGNSSLQWSAPQLGPYEDLLLWTETAAPVVIGEAKVVALDGTLVAPEAPVSLNARNGGIGVTASMQVVGRTVRVTGAGTFRLEPTPGRATGSLTRQVRLIR